MLEDNLKLPEFKFSDNFEECEIVWMNTNIKEDFF